MVSRIADIIEKITEYFQIKMEQVKLRAVGFTSRILANFLALVLIMLVGSFFVFFFTFAMGSLLNEVLESTFLGYLIIAGVYLIFIVIVILLTRSGKIQSWLENIILQIAEHDNEHED